MRIGIIGAGAVGTFFGASLARAGHEVTVLARGKTVKQVRSVGLTVTGGVLDESPVAVRAAESADELGGQDVVLLAVKATGGTVGERRAQIEALIGGIPGEPVIATTQNSVEVHQLVADIVGEERTWPGVVRGFFIHTGPATVRFDGGVRSYTFGSWDGGQSELHPAAQAEANETPDQAQSSFAEALDGAGIDGVVLKNVWTDIWSKAMFVTCFGALGAVADQPLGELRSTLRDSLVALMQEVDRTARAAGVDLPADTVDRTMGFTDDQPDSATSSMQRDIADGDTGELDSQLGAVVRAGDKAGVETPLHDLLLSLLTIRLTDS